MRVRKAEDIGRLIRQRRLDLGWTQQALARRVGVSRLWLLRVEQGRPGAQLGLILEALRALGLSILIEAEPERPPAAVDVDAILDATREDDA